MNDGDVGEVVEKCRKEETGNSLRRHTKPYRRKQRAITCLKAGMSINCKADRPSLGLFGIGESRMTVGRFGKPGMKTTRIR